ncbi:MAG: pyridoxamine 5'-phosphate oxidase family protein [Candidatus Bathyarchaeota archaeon]|nr:pyridoxamine 5'-phosphate oxidase family protein [Candidatus Bathyarchaeota archaeon]
MTILSDEIIEMMKKSQIKYLATAGRSGIPNVAAIGSPIIDPTDKSQILIANISLNKTIENLQENKNVMVLFHTPFTTETRPPDFKTYQVTGVADEKNLPVDRRAKWELQRFPAAVSSYKFMLQLPSWGSTTDRLIF